MIDVSRAEYAQFVCETIATNEHATDTPIETGDMAVMQLSDTRTGKVLAQAIYTSCNRRYQVWRKPKRKTEIRESIFDPSYVSISRLEAARTIKRFRRAQCAFRCLHGFQLLQMFDYAFIRYVKQES